MHYFKSITKAFFLKAFICTHHNCTIIKHHYFLLQLTVRAQDRSGSEGSQFSVATVTVLVPRDEEAPQFTGPFNAKIVENLAVNTSVVTAQALDPDQKVKYII